MFWEIAGVLILFNLCGVFANKHSVTYCEKVNHKYAHSTGQFIECVIKADQPVKYCEKCLSTYFDMLSKYADLINATDPTTNEQCKAVIIDNDRLNLAVGLLEQAEKIWEDGNCAACYDPNCDLETFKKLNGTCNNSTEIDTFGPRSIEFDGCYDRHKTQNNTCEKCNDEYGRLNNYYEKIHKKKGDKLCFDIIDKMNQTRILWSKTLHCCEDRNTSKLIFFVLSSSSFALTAAFYIGVFIHGRRSQVQFIANDLMPSDRGSENTANQTVTASDENVINRPSTSSGNGTTTASKSRKRPKQANILGQSDTETDDDDLLPLPIVNTNLMEI